MDTCESGTTSKRDRDGRVVVAVQASGMDLENKVVVTAADGGDTTDGGDSGGADA